MPYIYFVLLTAVTLSLWGTGLILLTVSLSHSHVLYTQSSDNIVAAHIWIFITNINRTSTNHHSNSITAYRRTTTYYYFNNVDYISTVITYYYSYYASYYYYYYHISQNKSQEVIQIISILSIRIVDIFNIISMYYWILLLSLYHKGNKN